MSGARPVTWLNGALMSPEDAGIAPGDRGFTLGDGAFETLKAVDGHPLRWSLHLARLTDALATLGIELPMGGAGLRAAAGECVRACGATDCSVRISVSRGAATTRGLVPGGPARPTVVVEARPFPGYPDELHERGMRLVTSAIPRNERSPLARMKSLSYLENVLARLEAQAAGADEVLVMNTSGGVAGASAANLFAVFRASRSRALIVTPPVVDGALPGTVRRLVLDELAPRCGLRVEEGRLLPGMLKGPRREVFLTNALMGVMPVTRIDGRPVGGGRPGAFTARLAAALSDHEREEMMG